MCSQRLHFIATKSSEGASGSGAGALGAGHDRQRVVVDEGSRGADPEARAFFDTLSGNNRYAILYRVQDAKKPETRAKRIEKFVAMCHAHETVHPNGS